MFLLLSNQHNFIISLKPLKEHDTHHYKKVLFQHDREGNLAIYTRQKRVRATDQFLLSINSERHIKFGAGPV